MPSINLDLNYFDHPKTKRLVGLLGRGADVLPVRVWCACGRHYSDSGKLTGLTAQEIESQVGWWGLPGKMIAAMVQVGFLEGNDVLGYSVHDWLDHSGHLAVYRARAKAAAQARWGKGKNHASSNASSIKADASSMPDDCNLPDASSMENASSIKNHASSNASSIKADASSMPDDCNLPDASSMENASSIKNHASSNASSNASSIAKQCPSKAMQLRETYTQGASQTQPEEKPKPTYRGDPLKSLTVAKKLVEAFRNQVTSHHGTVAAESILADLLAFGGHSEEDFLRAIENYAQDCARKEIGRQFRQSMSRWLQSGEWASYASGLPDWTPDPPKPERPAASTSQKSRRLTPRELAEGTL